jgi:hypothetical protein
MVVSFDDQRAVQRGLVRQQNEAPGAESEFAHLGFAGAGSVTSPNRSFANFDVAEPQMQQPARGAASDACFSGFSQQFARTDTHSLPRSAS